MLDCTASMHHLHLLTTEGLPTTEVHCHTYRTKIIRSENSVVFSAPLGTPEGLAPLMYMYNTYADIHEANTNCTETA